MASKKIAGKTLLQIAQELDIHKSRATTLGDEEIELALAWARGEVRQKQVIKALQAQGKLGVKTSNIYTFLAKALQQNIVNNA